MPKNWKTYKLEEVLDIKNGKSKPKETGDIPIYGGNGVLGYTNRFNNDTEVIIIGRVGAYCGSVFYENIKIWISDNAMFAKAKLIGYNKYLFYSLKYLDLNSFAGGSSQPLLTQDTLNRIELELPPLPEQKQIANILSVIDDKIENNLAINKTLEDMAMALYKNWFVDFSPFQEGEFVDSELGLIPKGWEVKIIGNVIDTLGGGTPKTTENSYWENGDILWYSPTDLTRDNAMFSLDSSKRINNLGLLKSSAKLFPPYSLLMSSRATIGALTINTIKASTNQGFITMIPNDNMSVYQLYSWTKWNMDLIISKSNGSTFKEISKANFRSLEIVVGQNIELFLRESKNIFDKVENNIQENQSLTKLRDTLLPKLISGEVRLKEFREGIDAEMNSA